MKKMIPLVLGSLLLLGATACTDTSDSSSVRDAQVESDARAQDQRDRTNTDNTETTDSVREDQLESDARAQDQRDRTNDTVTPDDSISTDQAEADARAQDQRDRNIANNAARDEEIRTNQAEADARAQDQRDRNTANNAARDEEIRTNQAEADARAQDQRDQNTADTVANDDSIRENQRESDARAREQRDSTNIAANNGQQTTGDLAVDVRNSLETNLPGSRLAVDLDDNNGMATIDGTVLTQAQFDEIEPLVMGFEGIRSVDVNAKVDPN